MQSFPSIRAALVAVTVLSTLVDGTIALGGNSSVSSEPCAILVQQVASTRGQMVDAGMALACLRSVPLDFEDGTEQLLGVQTMAEFQSTLILLKDPPAGYEYPAVDILSGLEEIYERLSGNSYYKNEYDFQLDIFKLIVSSRDGHFNYAAEIVYGILQFQRENNLFSLSTDGQALPGIYVDIDIPALAGPVGYTASPVTQIDDVDVESFLDHLATASTLNQDRDASYNSLFPSTPNAENGLQSFAFFHQSPLFPGNSIALTFKNGSEHSMNNYAVTTADWTGIKSGQDVFEKFCKGQAADGSTTTTTPASATLSAVPSAASSANAPTTFPQPLAISSDRMAACYFPDSSPDLAVLSIPAFLPSDATVPSVEGVTRTCITESKPHGRTRLIADLRGNGGGNEFMAADTFRRLFPSMVPYETTNMRAFPMLNDLGQIVTDALGNVSRPTSEEAQTIDGSPYNARLVLDVNEQAYESWDALYGPIQVHGDNFMNLLRYNFSNSYQATNTPISGYNGVPLQPEQVFGSDDIVLLQDGQCGSTCALFAEYMRKQGNVQQVVIGGRKQLRPMAAIGGIKGGNVYSASDLVTLVEFAFKSAPPAIAAKLKSQYGDKFAGLTAAVRRAASLRREGQVAHFNSKNVLRKGDKSVTPMQFVSETADCRLFYTPEMVLIQTAVWAATYRARWQDDAVCVNGSTGQPSSLSGSNARNGTLSQSNGGAATFAAVSSRRLLSDWTWVLALTVVGTTLVR